MSDPQETKVVTVEPKSEARATNAGRNVAISDMKPAQMSVAIEEEKERRKLINEFVKSQLVSGTDFGTININGRESKPCLFKPGMEKIFSLFGIRSELEKDEVTLSMIDAKNTICYIAKLYKGNRLIGEGRGACSIAEKQNNVNTAIKIAEKRARMDACLNIGFSEHFTQDLEDMSPEERKGLGGPEMPPAPSTGAASRSYESRQEGGYAKQEDANEHGEITITVLDKKSGTKRSGGTWEAVNTELGRFWNNSDQELFIGVTYDVEAKGNSIVRIIEDDGGLNPEQE